MADNNGSDGGHSSGGFDRSEEKFIADQRERDDAREKRLSRRDDDDEEGPSINSLMDILVILLVFLLKSYGDQPVTVTGTDLRVPDSSTKLAPEDMTTVTITRGGVLVNDEKVTDVPVDKSQKRGGDTGMEISPLLERLNTVVENKKREVKMLGNEFNPVATVIADKSTPYRLLTEVMYTAGQAGLSKFKFAVIKKKRKNVGP